ncbi:SEC-C domain-containing protein [Streptomyces kunmingensis]|uniref:SEC-C domain-containing protein n=1 Tax=Streptomyces kunmingensis TaxID=68225 RepID=A0ABU6CJP3_9ACTN|nr:SEC-C domain-containing protein [Streptomyces kunmingensis]MEB3964933.1 SEC-C domain-containing protein [Streptomyces kunmingensis]
MAKRKKARKSGSTGLSRREPTPAELVQQALELASRHPADALAILREEATWLVDEGHDAEALHLFDEALSAARASAGRETELDLDAGRETELEIGADRMFALERVGRGEEAYREALRIRAAHPRSTATWEMLAEFLEGREEYEKSAAWFTAGLSHFLGSTALDEKVVEAARDRPGGFAIDSLITGRHRVRRRLGVPHDEVDDLAHQVHKNSLYNVLIGDAEDLDLLHDPRRQDLLDPDRERTEDEEREYARILGEQSERLGREVAARRGALSQPRMTTVLYWPPDQFAALCARRPALAGAYHDTDAERSREVEKALRDLSDQGALHLGVSLGDADDFDHWLDEQHADPSDGETRARYGDDLAARGPALPWPPARNLPCWCASERKYKKCHGAPGAV